MSTVCSILFQAFANELGGDYNFASNAQSFAMMATLLHPRSRGTVTLAGSDPLAPPVIDPQYLSDRRDVGWLQLGSVVFSLSAFCAVHMGVV